MLGSTEAEIVSATASVAGSSVQYWDANFEGWYYSNCGCGGDREPIHMESVDGDGDIHLMGGGFWGAVKRIAGGDVGGAVGGAIAGSFAGGVGAGPGALAGGAGGSAAVATVELLNML